MAIQVTFWPILVDFYLTSHQYLSNHVILVANFEKFYLKNSPDFILNFRKSHQISKNYHEKLKELWTITFGEGAKDPMAWIGLEGHWMSKN